MLITRGFGTYSGGTGTGETIFVPICGTDIDITGASDSRVDGQEILSMIQADSTQTEPILYTESLEVTTTIDITQLTPIIRPKE